jgi:hypothetical protein
MKLASAIEGGITGATTLTLLQEALHKMDAKAPQDFLHKSGILKKLKKHTGKLNNKNKFYIDLAGELLKNASYFGLAGLGKRKNAVLTGGLLGAAAGLGMAFLNEDEDEKNEGLNNATDAHATLNKKLLTIILYTTGGLLAGTAFKRINKKTLKKIRKTFKTK